MDGSQKQQAERREPATEGCVTGRVTLRGAPEKPDPVRADRGWISGDLGPGLGVQTDWEGAQGDLWVIEMFPCLDCWRGGGG